MNKQDLKAGMTLSLKGGGHLLLIERRWKLSLINEYNNEIESIDLWNSDLKFIGRTDIDCVAAEYDIMEVFEPAKENILNINFVQSGNWCNTSYFKSIWKREEEKHEYSYPEGFKIDSVSWNGDGEYTGIVISGKQYNLNITK